MHTNRLEERLTDTLDRRRPAKQVEMTTSYGGSGLVFRHGEFVLATAAANNTPLAKTTTSIKKPSPAPKPVVAVVVEAPKPAPKSAEELEAERFNARLDRYINFIMNLSDDVYAFSCWGSYTQVLWHSGMLTTVSELDAVEQELRQDAIELARLIREASAEAEREAAEREEAESLAYRLPPIEAPRGFGNELMRVDGRRGQFSRRQAKKAKAAKHRATKRQLDELSFAANAPKIEAVQAK